MKTNPHACWYETPPMSCNPLLNVVAYVKDDARVVRHEIVNVTAVVVSDAVGAGGDGEIRFVLGVVEPEFLRGGTVTPALWSAGATDVQLFTLELEGLPQANGSSHAFDLVVRDESLNLGFYRLLRVWVDGRAVASKSVDTPLAWGAAGSWRLGANGGGNGLDGRVLRAGVETSAWSQTQWATLYRQTVGAAS